MYAGQTLFAQIMDSVPHLHIRRFYGTSVNYQLFPMAHEVEMRVLDRSSTHGDRILEVGFPSVTSTASSVIKTTDCPLAQSRTGD